MHELAITQALIGLVQEHAEKVGAKKVERINVVVGELSGFVGQSVEFYFDQMSAGTIMEDAKLTFKTIPMLVDAGTAVRNSTSRRWTGPAHPAKEAALSLSGATNCS